MTREELARAAETGDPAAGTAFAKHLLAGKAQHDVHMAADLLNRAARAGHGEAAAQIAVLIAAGARDAQDWQAALEYLQQAAEQDWQEARAQLMLLSADRDAFAHARHEPPPEIWGVLRRAVKLDEWFKAPALTRESTAPDIRMTENFLPAAACGWMIARARPFVSKAQTFDPATGKARLDADRSNSAALFDIVRSDLVLLAIRARIAAATGIPPNQFEETNVLHYAPGERFAQHFDFLEPDAPGFANEIAQKGQRVGTFLIYLNEEFEGAETDFSCLGRRFRPGRGGALFFSNVTPDGSPDRATLHAGLAPRTGEKWLLSQWIRSTVA